MDCCYLFHPKRSWRADRPKRGAFQRLIDDCRASRRLVGWDKCPVKELVWGGVERVVWRENGYHVHLSIMIDCSGSIACIRPALESIPSSSVRATSHGRATYH